MCEAKKKKSDYKQFELFDKTDKKLIMIEKEEHLFQQSKGCWICKKLSNNDEQKVWDHCHATGKFRGAVHWDCNINFQLTEKVLVIFRFERLQQLFNF